MDWHSVKTNGYTALEFVCHVALVGVILVSLHALEQLLHWRVSSGQSEFELSREATEQVLRPNWFSHSESESDDLKRLLLANELYGGTSLSRHYIVLSVFARDMWRSALTSADVAANVIYKFKVRPTGAASPTARPRRNRVKA